MSENKNNTQNTTTTPNNTFSFFSRFPPSPFDMNGPQQQQQQPYYPMNYCSVVPCNKCIELQNEMKNTELQMKLMNKNIELLNEQIKLLDLKLSIMSNKRYNNKFQKKPFNKNNGEAIRENQKFPYAENKIKQYNGREQSPLEPRLVIKINEKQLQQKPDITDKKKGPFTAPMGLLSSILSMIDNIDNKKETQNDPDEPISDDVSEYTSEDEFTELDIEIKTLDDLINIGKKYNGTVVEEQLKEDFTDELSEKDKSPNFVLQKSSIPSDSGTAIKGIMMRDDKIKYFNELKPEIPSDNPAIADGKKYGINFKTLNNLVIPLTKMNNMIGLHNIKNAIVDMILYYLQNFENKNNNLLHTVIEGAPGVGKTEVGKLLAEIYAKLGVIPSDRFTLVKRTDLIGRYLGETAAKTQQVIDEAEGGVLFIDEAYSLGNEEKKDIYSKECIDVLNQNLTEKRKKLIVIVAGYAEQLDKCFFSVNPGLASRFAFRFKIEEYNANEIKEIFIKKVGDIKWKLDGNVDQKILIDFFIKNKTSFPHFGRDIEHLITNCKFVHSRRVFGKHPKHKRKLTIVDINNGFDRYIEHKKKNDELSDSVKMMYGRF
jgi:hypothetical protein